MRPEFEETAQTTAAGSQAAAVHAHMVHIRPRIGWAPLELCELWHHRELLGFLVWRDLKVRYKQTLLGAGWAVLQPLATMIVFTIFFGRLPGMPSDGVPYPIFSFTSLLLWTYFAGAVSLAANSVVQNQATISKIYFPRLLLPIAAIVPTASTSRVLMILAQISPAFMLSAISVAYFSRPSV